MFDVTSLIEMPSKLVGCLRPSHARLRWRAFVLYYDPVNDHRCRPDQQGMPGLVKCGYAAKEEREVRTASFIVLSILCASAALAAGTTVTLDANNMPLSEVAKSFLDQTGVQVVLDAGVTVAVTAKLEGVELEQALNVLAQVCSLNWQRIYARPDENGRIPMEQVKAQLDVLAAMQSTPVVVYDPTTKQETVFARVEPSASQKALDPSKLGLKAFYFVFKPKPPEAKQETREDPTKKLADLGRQRIETFLRMTPEQQKIAAQQDMMWMMNMPQDAQLRLMTGMFDAARNLDPVLQHQFQHTMREVFRQMGPQRGGGRRGG